ncbi:hypothetical protein D030_4556A, partial [Vibrio parahaemolyticus AQ3810]
MQSRLLDGF